MQKKVTLKFLAERLGLSKAAVSSVLNNAPLARSFARETRERIFKAADEYNYKPNYFARYLNHRRSYLIGVLSPDLAEGYNAGVLEGIEEHLLQSDYHYFLASHEWSEARIERTIQMFMERGVDGIILINTPLSSGVELPLAVIGKANGAQRGISIMIDNHAGIRRALEHLVSLGHRKIAFIKGHKDSADTEDRWDAVVTAAQHLAIKVDPKLVVQLERLGAQQISALEEGARCAQRLLSRRREFTALMAFNDISAIGALNCFREHGRRIPQDLSVVGFDDVLAARIVYPALTTVQQPLQVMGETAAREVIKAIANGAKDQQLVLTPQLVVRNSTAPARATRSKRVSAALQKMS
jgi:DNA-binding LacI/PurR family transcriptional regulator